MKILNVTLNPSDMGTGITLSNGNLSYSGVTTRQAVRATHGKTSGKWYWEVKLDSGAIANVIGISNKSFPLSYADNSPYWRSFYPFGSSSLRFPESTSYGSGWVVGDIIGVALDLDNGTLEFYKNGLSMGVSHKDVKDLGEVYPTIATMNANAKTITFNFGATPFAYSVPPKFNAYNVEINNKFLISLEDKMYSIEEVGYENMIPKMASNNSASPIVPIYSGEFVGGPGAGQGYAYQAFDDKTETSACPTTMPIYLGIDFSSQIRIDKYSITSSSATTNLPATAWVFEASNDNLIWTTLDTQTSVSWSSSTTKEFVIANTEKFRYYRIRPTINGTYFYADIKMLKYISPMLKYLDNGSEAFYLEHGIERENSIDLLDEVTRIKDVKSINTSLGSGKLFRHPIDRLKHPANKIILG